MGFLFDSKPIEAWRAFRWAAATEAASLFDLAAVAPAGTNPYAWARLRRLHSVGVDAAWPERQPMVASCSHSTHAGVAVKGCTCGLWGVKDKLHAENAARSYGGWIIARVALWGHFVEHSKGWRAEYGYPLEVLVLCLDGRKKARTEGLMQEIGDRYGVPVQAAEFTPAPPKPKPAKPPRSSRVLKPHPPPSDPWPVSIVHPSQLWTTVSVHQTLGIITPPSSLDF